MTPEELTQFKALAAKYEPGKDKDEVLKVVKGNMHEVFQDINDGGRSAANTANKEKLDKLQGDLDAATAAKVTAETRLKELNDKAPDAAALRVQYERDLKAAAEAHAAALTAKDKELADTLLEGAKGDLANEFIALGVDPDYAKTVLVKDDKVVGRLKPDGKKVSVLKKGEDKIFLVPTEEKHALTLLAEEVVPNVPTKWRTSKVRGGTGLQGGTSGGGGEGSSRFEQIRKEEQERGKQQEKAKERPSGAQRLGRR